MIVNSTPPGVMTAPDQKTWPDDILTLCSRFDRCLSAYDPTMAADDRFVCLVRRERCVIVMRLGLLGGQISTQLVELVERRMEGRRVLAKAYPQWRIAIFQISRQANRNDFEALPAFDDRQVVIFGGSGGGKSTTIKHVLRGRQGLVVVVDPHYQRGTGQWHSDWLIAGAGGDYAEIDRVIETVAGELLRRIRSGAQQGSHRPLHVAIDEMSNILGSVEALTVQRIYEIVRQGRKYSIFMILTPHSVEVKALGLEGSGGVRDSFLFIRMPKILPGEKDKPRVVEIYLGTPSKGGAHDGRYLIPPPVIYQGEPRLIKAADLERILGVSEGVSQGVSQGVSEMGHGQDTGKTGDSTPGHTYEERYARGTDAAFELALFLAGYGYGIRKIAEALPYRAEDARFTAEQALEQVEAVGVRPVKGSDAEAKLVRLLREKWGMPDNRIARLLDGKDHEVLGRVSEMVKGAEVKRF